MTITHQTVLDEEGKPVAALIPWDEFKRIQECLSEGGEVEISEEWREELRTRASDIDEGRVELIDGEDFLKRLRVV
jgi:PHD/YefM family antitoxin component YafN of YafNO toxin-antitoxin module